MKINFLETFNKEAGQVEKSSTRLFSLIWLIATIAFTGIYIYTADAIEWLGLTAFTLNNLVAVFIPSKLKELINKKNK